MLVDTDDDDAPLVQPTREVPSVLDQTSFLRLCWSPK